MAKNTVKIYYNKEGEYLYSGNQKEGDREATQAEIEYWTANGSTLEGDRAKKNAENTQAYNNALQAPLVCGQYLVIAEWINTYTNTYTYAKKCTDEGIVPTADIVAFNHKGKLETVTISSIEDFLPFYQTVADEWARITDIRNKYLVQIQNADAPKDIVISYAKGAEDADAEAEE